MHTVKLKRKLLKEGIAAVNYTANKSSSNRLSRYKSRIAPRFRVDIAGEIAWHKIDVRKMQSNLSRCFSEPIIRNSVLLALRFNQLFVITWSISERQSLSWRASCVFSGQGSGFQLNMVVQIMLFNNCTEWSSLQNE